MRVDGTHIELSATDLSQFLGCQHRTGLDLAVAEGSLVAPTWVDPVMMVLRERGLEHERGYAQTLRSQGLNVVDLSSVPGHECAASSIDAMRSGIDVILQGGLRNSHWFGRPDVLRRVGRPSTFGAWSYMTVDTKLAKETTGGTVLQLSLYSDMLAEVQGVLPATFVVVTPNPQVPYQEFRVLDFAAYFRLVRKRLASSAALSPDEIMGGNYPEPVEHCDVCRWRTRCDRRRRDDDHLSLVAGASRLQRRELEANGIDTLARLGTLALPLPFKPARGSREGYVRIREQARVQLEGRERGEVIHEVLPLTPDHGLTRLPAPSIGDVFLDFEGDPFAQEGGREYLFGTVSLEPGEILSPRSRWALGAGEEKAAFEELVDAIMSAWAAHPGMHVYHYAPYEPAAMKRLMGRYATRESEVDQMLRAGLFVDLYAVVRNSIRASVESYSIKDLEPLYGFQRTLSLADARAALRVTERGIELRTPDIITAEIRDAVERYNRDDCMSALRLREWLEGVRAGIEAAGTPVSRPQLGEGAAPEAIDERARRVLEMVRTLTHDVPAEPEERSEDQRGRWLLANLLDWHRREAKAPWWEYFRLRELSDEELLDERAALAGLSFDGHQGGTKRSPIDRYRYPQQDSDIRDGDELHLQDGTTFGSVHGIDRGARTLDVKKRGAHTDTHPTAVFAHTVVNTDVLAAAIERVGTDVIAQGLAGGTRYQVARELLLARAPRLHAGVFEPDPAEDAVRFAVRIAPELRATVLSIQGPPGTGKTFTGAQMICELVSRGMKVGVTAVSHKVIRNLLERAVAAAGERHVALRCAQKVTEAQAAPPGIDEVTDNADALAALAGGRAQVLGGTAWLWARPEFEGAVDVLFVDEAGQMSLANVLACSQAGSSVVLLGDPQQLEQPQQGVHPDGADVSALEHMLLGHKTVPAGRGIFLPETWRLAPKISEFTSEVFYEGRLHSRAGLERQVLCGTGPIEGAGLWVLAATHDGNQNSSAEEAELVHRLVEALLQPGSEWVDSEGVTHPMTHADVLVVAPYNAHVALLEERLGARGVRVGTVDRFQGQEAPVVVYSMATSRPEDAPRGMEFLYSLNRLNVATSRARCACVLVANPRLFEPECRSPRQMQLANAVCRYAELARELAL